MSRFEEVERRFKQRVEPISEPDEKDRLLLDHALEDLGGNGFAASDRTGQAGGVLAFSAPLARMLEQAPIRLMVPLRPYKCLRSGPLDRAFSGHPSLVLIL